MIAIIDPSTSCITKGNIQDMGTQVQMTAFLQPTGVLQTPYGEPRDRNTKGYRDCKVMQQNLCMTELVHNKHVSKSQAQEHELRMK